MQIVREREENVNASGAEVRAFAESIRRRLQARRAPGDRPAASWEDVEQNAALSVIETEARYGVPLRANRGYHASAARKTVGFQIARALARVSVPDNAAGRNGARDFQDGVPIAGCGYAEEESVDFAGRERPDARIAREERRAASSALVRLVAHHLRRRQGTRWRALELILGVGGEQAEDLAEAAWRTGVTTQAIVAAIDELADLLRTDRAARRLRNLIHDHMENR